MVRSCPLVLAAALTGFRALCGTAPRLCRMLARFPGGHDLQQRGPHLALEARAGRGRGCTVRQRRLGRVCHVVWAPVSHGPAAMARPRACRPDRGMPTGSGGLGGGFTSHSVVAPHAR